MDYGDHIDAIEREGAALVAALAACAPEAGVPSCPDWTVRDLAEHVAGSTGFWVDVVCDGTDQPKTGGEPHGEDGDLAALVAGRLDDLVGRLRSTPPDTAVWSWLEGQGTTAFVARRWANEMAIHRIDAQLAAGTPEPIDGDLAVDAVEEVFLMANAYQQMKAERAAAAGTDGDAPPDEPSAPTSLHLHAQDRAAQGDGEWLVSLGPDGVSVSREHAKAACAVQAAASDIALTLYQRPTLGEVTTFGDVEALDAWYRAFTFG